MRHAIARRLAFAIPLALVALRLAAAQEHTLGQRMDDLEFLLEKLREVHPALYQVHPREEWEREIEEFAARLEELDELGFYYGLARIASLAADGHTGVGPTPALRAALESSALPVRFDGFEDGVFVTAAEPGLAELVGARVAAMGGCPITEVVEAISAAVPADNPSSARLSSMRLLRLHAVLALLGFTDEDGAVSLSVELPDGQEVTQRLEPAPGVAMPRFGAPADWIDARGDAPRPAWLARAGEDCWFKYREEDRLLYVQFNAVRDPAGEPLARFWERVFAFIDDNLVERLVIDMRHNGGGNNYLNQPLVHGLVRCRELFRPGCVFVITSPRTFSAAVACAANIERETPTLFVGEPTGAGPNHAGDAERFTLPNSGLSLRVSALWWQWSDPRDRRRAIQPDLPAPLTFAVWRAGADPAMEAITAHREREAGELRAPNTNWRRNSQR